MKKLVGLGAGGHAKSIIDIVQLGDEYELVGLLDPNPKLHGTDILGIPVLGGDEILPTLQNKYINHIFIGVGSVGNTQPRQNLYEQALLLGFQIATIIHPSAVISASSKIGQGTVIMAGAILNADAQIHENVIINTGAIVEHDCIIEAHTHIASGARLAGTVHVAEGVHVGAGATIRQNISVGSRAVVGAGAVVVKDVPSGITVVGIPASPL